jgi:hypothetical protein
MCGGAAGVMPLQSSVHAVSSIMPLLSHWCTTCCCGGTQWQTAYLPDSSHFFRWSSSCLTYIRIVESVHRSPLGADVLHCSALAAPAVLLLMSPEAAAAGLCCFWLGLLGFLNLRNDDASFSDGKCATLAVSFSSTSSGSVVPHLELPRALLL